MTPIGWPDDTVQLFILIVAASLSYLIGYHFAEYDNTRIQRGLREQLRLAQRQRYEIGEWVRSNWPNEYAAYTKGHTDGYQQGIYHAQTLMEDADAQTQEDPHA